MTLTRVKGASVGADIKRQYATVATMTAGRGLRVGDIVQCAERANATFNVVDATTVTENTYNIIAGVADATISFVLRRSDEMALQSLGLVGNGVAVEDGAMANALSYASTNKVSRLLGDGRKSYLFQSELSPQSDLEIDFSGATVKDDVQGFWSEQGARAAPLFSMVGVENIEIKNFTYTAEATRDSVSAAIPTGIINIGKQGVTTETQNIKISGIAASNCIDHTIFISVLGESFNIEVDNINISGDCKIGFNAEYGIAPSADNKADAYGAHPHNITVNNFVGTFNTESTGFLRVAGVYNVEFNNCWGYNVTSFMYCHSGDQGISRLSQSVIYNDCAHYSSNSFIAANNTLLVVIGDTDGSTGSPKPAWSNYDALFEFNRCQIESNKHANSAAIRYIGTQGSTVFNNCLINNSTWGLRCGGSAGIATYTPHYSLEFNSCVFKENAQDMKLNTQEGALFNHCKFKEQDGVIEPISIEAGAKNNTFYKCDFRDMALDVAYVTVVAGATGNHFNECEFDSPGASSSLELLADTLVTNCISSDLFDTSGSFVYPSNYTGVQSFTPNLVGSTSGSQAQSGTYVKIGNQISFSLDVSSAVSGRPVGNITITGMPEASAGSYKNHVFGQRLKFVSGTATGFFAQIAASSTTLTLNETIDDNLSALVTNANMTNAGTVFFTVSGTYFV